ncbi:hypothetical protein OVA24_12400 [Luteolibacter sp. SL250]|nr:hypothetical protein OVA24_12400 [Luteolibacter sp. SL250]
MGESPVVWAVDEKHLANYLFPRDCPRVSFLSEKGHRIIHVENSWKERIRQSAIWVYEMPGENFESADAIAGYFVSREAVIPLDCRQIDDPTAALEETGSELHVVSSLWPIFDQVVSTQVEFSCIRMRNAEPRKIGPP